jgi:hypothetical protein
MKIEIMSYAQYNASGAADLMHKYDIHIGPLAVPNHIRLGAMGTDCGGGHDYTLQTWSDVVDEYAIWLEAQIKGGNQEVMDALDHLFHLSQRGTVVLVVNTAPDPFRTHAHEVRRTIMELARQIGD